MATDELQEIRDRLIPQMKIVILAAGGATRMQPLSFYITKPMLPVLETPLLGRIIENFQQAGFSQFIVVYGQAEQQIVPYVNELKAKYNLNVSFIQQPKPMGMADAILLTKNYVIDSPQIFIENEIPFFVSAGDVLFDATAIIQLLDAIILEKAQIALGLIHSLDEKMAVGYGNVKCVGTKVTGIVEKPGPDQKIDDFYSMPIYLFKPKIYEWLDKVELSFRGEKELQDAIQMAIDLNENVAGSNFLKNSITMPEDGEYHITYPRDFLAINRRYLRISEKDRPNSIGNYQIDENGSKLGPFIFWGNGVQLGKNCSIKNSYIFPNTIIGDNVEIIDSIIGPDEKIENNTHIYQKILLFGSFTSI